MQQEDRKRFTMAMMFMVVVMLAFSWYTNQKGRPPEDVKTGDEPTAPAPEEPKLPAVMSSAEDIGGPAEPRRALVLRTREMTVHLSSEGAGIERLELLSYHPSADEQDKPLTLLSDDILTAGGRTDAPRRKSLVIDGMRDGADLEHWNWRLVALNGAPPQTEVPAEMRVGSPVSVEFAARRGEMEVHKTFTFKPEGFDIGLEVSVTNRGAQRRQVEYRVIGAAGLCDDDPNSKISAVTAILAGRDGPRGGLDTREVNAADAIGYAKKETPEKMELSRRHSEWAAMRGHYFAATLMPDDPSRIIMAFAEPLDAGVEKADPTNLTAGLKVTDFALEPGRVETHGFTLRAGPQIYDQLDDYTYKSGELTVSRGLSASVNFGWNWHAWLSKLLLQLLRLFAHAIPNYGVCIALVTVAVKLALHPLSYKGQKSMQRMQELGPKVKELQSQFKNDPDKLRQAQMRLFKEEGVNPAGGCLPLMLQMPVFFALYGAIRGAFEFRQAPFLWVTDLSRPDAVMSLDFWPGDLNLLPIIYGGLMMLQGFMQPLPTEPQARQTALMMRFMPLMFFVFIYRLPSAFVLYFTISAIVGLAESQYIKFRLRRLKAAAEAASGGDRYVKDDGCRDESKPAEPPDPASFWQAEAERKMKGTKGRR